MAEELRWETLLSTSVADGNAVGEFRNDTSGNIFIRSIDMFHMVQLDTVSDADVNIRSQLSKSNTIDLVNNTSIWQLNNGQTCTLAGAGDNGNGGGVNSVNKLYAKGQLILEPGESIFLHLNADNAPTTSVTNNVIGYHF